MATRVVIVGGGLMGLSAAFHLRRADPATRVTVLERARVGAAASGASAAGVRAMGRDPAERALALASLARWPGLDAELEAPTRYRRTGGLRVALDEATWRTAGPWVAEQRADGVPVEIVDAPSARAACASTTSTGTPSARCSATQGSAARQVASSSASRKPPVRR